MRRVTSLRNGPRCVLVAFASCSTTNSCQTIGIPATTGRFWSGTIVSVVRAFATRRFGADHPESPAAEWPSYRELVLRYGPSVAGTTVPGGE